MARELPSEYTDTLTASAITRAPLCKVEVEYEGSWHDLSADTLSASVAHTMEHRAGEAQVVVADPDHTYRRMFGAVNFWSGGSADSGKLGPARKVKAGEDEGYFTVNAAAVKEAVSMPVMLVGGLRSPAVISRIREETGMDYFSLSRPLIREPHLIKRWKEGDTRPSECVSCSACFLSIKKGKGIHCLKKRGG